jgi:hypothetical protein
MVFAREATAAGVIEPIRSGRTVAIDQFGHRYGDASLIQLLDTVTLVDRPDVDPPVETLFGVECHSCLRGSGSAGCWSPAAAA